ncbi:MAG TPA: hypothetical protein VK752_00665 [Bryobacteraceae bacterium]|jgi:hypothetical protein|nr:hypothetical protein [Bryobacteraceae bacterium]
MLLKTLAPVLLLPLFATAAQLPELRTEPIGGGTVFFVKNTSSQPLTGYLIELVNYPGSSYSLFQDEIGAEPLAPGAEKRIQVTNMTAGAVPDYMHLTAAIYADGSTAGAPEKVTQFIERRKAVLATTRELIGRLEKGATKADLKQWADSLQPVGKVKPNSQPVINQTAARGLVLDTAARLESHSTEETLGTLRSSEKSLAESKPAL